MDGEEVELLNYLTIVKDPRLDRKKLHLLKDILFIAVCASLCGCDTWEDIYLFAQIREDWFRKFIALP